MTLRKIFCHAALACISTILFSSRAGASQVGLDSISVSTIGGQANANGIAITSYVSIADGGGLVLQGSGGYISTQSSVTASAFFGDVSGLAGIGIFSATQTFSGADTFSSSFTVESNGRQVILSTTASANIISISTQGVISFTPTLHNSSSTAIPAYSTTNNLYGPCVSGSTLTIATTGGMIEVTVQTNMSTVGNATTGLSFLQDGAFVRDLSPILASTYVSPEASSGVSVRLSYLVDAPPVGIHSYCLTIASQTNIGSASIGNAVAANIFYVKELK